MMRTLITAILVTGLMVSTGCSYTKQPDAYVKKSDVCFDQGRSGYWCPNTDKAVASDASTKTDQKIPD